MPITGIALPLGVMTVLSHKIISSMDLIALNQLLERSIYGLRQRSLLLGKATQQPGFMNEKFSVQTVEKKF